MIAMLNFIELATATVFAVAVAAVFSWVSLRMAFVLMQPATARDLAPRTDLARGTAQLARAYAANR
jgi:hypothetical protein